MITTGDFKKGGRILYNAEPHTIEDYSVSSPSARGASTLVRAKLRNIVSGVLVDKTFKAGEKFEVPDVTFGQIQFLYNDGEACHFMDVASYEQFERPNDTIEKIAPWLTEDLKLSSVSWNGNVIGINLPQHVEAEVAMVGGGSRSDTASSKSLKDATLTNGLEIKVPVFVENGEKILVDPTTGEFVRRA